MKDILIKPHRKNTLSDSQESYDKVLLNLTNDNRLNKTDLN